MLSCSWTSPEIDYLFYRRLRSTYSFCDEPDFASWLDGSAKDSLRDRTAECLQIESLRVE